VRQSRWDHWVRRRRNGWTRCDELVMMSSYVRYMSYDTSEKECSYGKTGKSIGLVEGQHFENLPKVIRDIR
jgi:hypothetical protein